MPTAKEKNNRTRSARRVTALEGGPKNVLRSKNFGEGEAGRTPAKKPIRGYIKLSQATKAFNYDFRGKIVLDIGSSTGGFTKYALDHGAQKVIAIEKGTNQMMKPLRFDKRIDLHEKTDVFNIRLASQGAFATTGANDEASPLGGGASKEATSDAGPALNIDCAPDVIVADVSFISLRNILKHAKSHLAQNSTDFLVMLKPQFEAKPFELSKGIVKNEKIRREIIKNFEAWLKVNHFVIIKKRDNTLKGKTGNTERFYWLKLSI